MFILFLVVIVVSLCKKWIEAIIRDFRYISVKRKKVQFFSVPLLTKTNGSFYFVTMSHATFYKYIITFEEKKVVFYAINLMRVCMECVYGGGKVKNCTTVISKHEWKRDENGRRHKKIIHQATIHDKNENSNINYIHLSAKAKKKNRRKNEPFQFSLIFIAWKMRHIRYKTWFSLFWCMFLSWNFVKPFFSVLFSLALFTTTSISWTFERNPRAN